MPVPSPAGPTARPRHPRCAPPAGSLRAARRRGAAIRLGVPLLAVITAGCATQDRPADPSMRIEVVEGVEHVIHGGDGRWTDADRWQLVEAEAVEIGALDGDGPDVFGAVRGAVVDEAGRIHVADAQAFEVRVFSATGDFLFRYGRNGEGPGEFRNMSGIGRDAAGGTAVLDGSLARVSRFDAQGEFQGAIRLERAYLSFGHNVPVRFDTAGRLHDRVLLPGGIHDPERTAWVRYAPGTAPDTLQVAEGQPAQHVLLNAQGLPMMSMPVPFSPRVSTAIAPDGSVYVTLAADYRIARLSYAGDTVRVIRREIDPRPASATERGEALERMAEAIRNSTGTEPRDLPQLPDHHPALLTLLVDELGYLWAARPGDHSSVVWDVFDDDGALLGSVETGGMEILHIADSMVVGLLRDDLGVERIRMVPLQR